MHALVCQRGDRLLPPDLSLNDGVGPGLLFEYLGNFIYEVRRGDERELWHSQRAAISVEPPSEEMVPLHVGNCMQRRCASRTEWLDTQGSQPVGKIAIADGGVHGREGFARLVFVLGLADGLIAFDERQEPFELWSVLRGQSQRDHSAGHGSIREDEPEPICRGLRSEVVERLAIQGIWQHNTLVGGWTLVE